MYRFHIRGFHAVPDLQALAIRLAPLLGGSEPPSLDGPGLQNRTGRWASGAEQTSLITTVDDVPGPPHEQAVKVRITLQTPSGQVVVRGRTLMVSSMNPTVDVEAEPGIAEQVERAVAEAGFDPAPGRHLKPRPPSERPPVRGDRSDAESSTPAPPPPAPRLDENDLLRALEAKDHELVGRCLDAGVSARSKLGGDSVPAISIAAQRGDTESVRRLLEAGADPKAPCGDGLTPLEHATHGGRVEIVQLLLDRASNSARARTLRRAVHGGQSDLVRLLLDGGLKVDGEDPEETLVCVAARNGHLEVVELLDERGADRDRPGPLGRPPLVWARENGHQAVVSYLEERGASEELGLGHIVRYGAPADLAAYLDQGGSLDVTVWSRPPLQVAATFRNARMITALVDAGVDVNETTQPVRVTALHEACSAAKVGLEGGVETITALLDAGAVVAPLDRAGRTPLFWAVRRGNLEAVQLLLDRGAPVEVPPKGRIKRIQSTLAQAEEQGHNEILELLQRAQLHP